MSAGVGYLVVGTSREGRRRVFGRFLICEGCYVRGAPDPVTGLSRPDAARQAGGVRWFELLGRGPALAPEPCVGCGLVVVRRAEALLKGVTCSRACRTSLTRKRHGGRGSGRPCGSCGQPVTVGRADSVYCDARCRQKAYRRRKARRIPDAGGGGELLAALAPFVVAPGRGISKALYKALYSLHVAHQGGHGQQEPLARLTAMDPERVRLPDTQEGRRLRAALRGMRGV
ncbi:hypothetical protein GCM10010278_65190 [Streptomyces melanogenes]|nr:hypothetical protein GCM10010278_65190 [Streptomyces melanogenes]